MSGLPIIPRTRCCYFCEAPHAGRGFSEPGVFSKRKSKAYLWTCHDPECVAKGEARLRAAFPTIWDLRPEPIYDPEPEPPAQGALPL